MPVLADPRTIAGQLSAADLDRTTNTGRIYLHRGSFEPGAVVDDRAAEALWRDACAAEGGIHADPAPAMESMFRYRRIVAALKGAVGLVLLLAVVSAAVQVAGA